MDFLETMNFLLFLLMCIDGMTGIYLVIRAIQKKIKTVLFLGSGFILSMLSIIFVIIFELSWDDVAFPLMLAYFFMIPFTQLTFHRNGNQAYWLLYILMTALIIIKVIFAYWHKIAPDRFNNAISTIVEIIITFIAFAWSGAAALQAYHIVKKDDIEPWIKKRLQLFGVGSWIMAFQGFPQILWIITDTAIEEESTITIIVMILAVLIVAIFAFLMIISWIMPHKVKLFFNKGHQIKEPEELSLNEEDIMKQLQVK